MNRVQLLFILSLFIFEKVHSQQDPGYSLYVVDKMLINPAFTGSSNWAVGTLKYRNNLTGFNGQYSTQTINFHAPVQAKHIGLGFKIINDKRAILNNLNFTLDLSYHLNFAKGKLSFGLEGGIYNRRVSYDKLILSKHGDEVIPINASSSTVPDLSYGSYYQRKQFYIGYSQYHLLKRAFDKKTIPTSGSHLYSQNNLIIGNVFDISKNWSLETSLFIKYQPQSKIQMDLNLILCYSEKISAGIQLRTNGTLISILKFNITESLKIAYSFDYNLSKFSQYSHGAHEIVISYGIKLPPPPSKREIHPRYYF